MQVEEERRIAEVGEEIKVRVRIHPDASYGLYRVQARSDATFSGPSILSLTPGGSGTFVLVSDRPGSARVHVKLIEVKHDLDPLVAPSN
jgi:hypothetical protein